MFLRQIFIIGIFLFVVSYVSAATNDVTVNGDIVISDVTFENTTSDMIIFATSSAENFAYSSGSFTVVNPDSTDIFKIGSSNSSVKSIIARLDGDVKACAENSSPGISYVSLPTDSGTYAIEPTSDSECTSNCQSLNNVNTYNTFPTCGAASCNFGYNLVGSGADAMCSSGGPFQVYPDSISMNINNNDTTTATASVILFLGATEANRINICNDSEDNFFESNWQDYETFVEWKLSSGGGNKKVFVKFNHFSGGVSGPIVDSIFFDSDLEVKKQEFDDEQNRKRESQMFRILNQASVIYNGDIEKLLKFNGVKRAKSSESEIFDKYVKLLIKDENTLTKKQINAVVNFIMYSYESKNNLGIGESSAVINSFKTSFDRIPRTKTDWEDVVKIANGRWTKQRSKQSEDNAKKLFKIVYLRSPDMNNPNDNAAVNVIGYGLMSDKRRLDKEKVAIKFFNAIFKYNPKSTVDWNVVRAITYSGASR